MKNKKVLRKEMIEELTRKDILKSAVDVLLEKGIKQFTMDHVALQAGIAKGTIYLYYKNKDELLYSVVEYCYEPLDKIYDNIMNAEYKPAARLEKFVIESLRFAENNKKIFNEVKTIMYNTLYQAFGDKKSWYWHTVNMFAKVLDEGIKSGLFRPVKTEKVAVMFSETINSYMSHRILAKVRETVEEDTRVIMDLFLKGLIKN